MRFVVGNGVLSASAARGSTVNHATSVVFDVARWVSFVGFALLVGAWLVIAAWPAGRDERRARGGSCGPGRRGCASVRWPSCCCRGRTRPAPGSSAPG